MRWSRGTTPHKYAVVYIEASCNLAQTLDQNAQAAFLFRVILISPNVKFQTPPQMPDMNYKHLTRTIAALALTLFVLGSNSALAGNTWDGGGSDNNWSSVTNWSGDTAPGYGTLVFNGTTQTTNNNNSITAMNQVNWNGGAAWGMTGSSTLSLFDFGGTQAKLESLGSGGVTIDAPIIFAAINGTPPNPFGEINAVSSDLTFSGGTLTVNGSSVNGIKMFGGGNTVNFNNTVNASGKWFATAAVNIAAGIGGSFTNGDFYLMNNGTLNLASGGSFSTSALRLGGDFGNTGNQNQTLGGTFNLTSATGGQTFASTINCVSGNSSGNLVIHSANTSGTNTLSGGIFLDSGLRITNAFGGTLALGGTTDVKAQQIIFGPSGTINAGTLISTFGTGTLLLNGPGTLNLSATNNTHTGTNNAALNASGTQISGNGTLLIAGDGSLGLIPAGNYNNIQFIGSGTLRAANNISLAATRNVFVSPGAVGTLNAGGNTLTVNGAVTGAGQVVISGAGTTVLATNNAYIGGTAIGPGTLRVTGQTGSSSGTGGGLVFVNGGGTLSGNGRVNGPVTVANAASAAIYPNSGGTLTFGSSLAFGSNSVAKFDLTPTTNGANDKVVLLNQTLTCSGATVTINITNATLSASDYVLLDVGTSGTISGAFSSTPAFTGTPPNYAAGYSIVTVGKTVVLRYTPVSITVTSAAGLKIYDGTNTSAVPPTITAGTLEPGDAGSFTQTFDNRNVGVGKTLTPSGTVTNLAGDAGARYNITFASIATGQIDPLAITVTAAADTRAFDGTTNSTGTPTITSGALAPGDSAIWTQTFDSPNVGARTLTPAGNVSDGNSGNNYAVMFNTAAGSITAVATTLNLTSTTNLSQLNSNVTFTATVAPAAASGDVVFKNGPTPFGTNTLAAGMATFTTSALPGGTNIITAEYAGDGNYSGSTNSLNQAVNVPPVASAYTTNVTAGSSVTVTLVGGINALTDAEGDALTVTSATLDTPANGGSLALIGGTNAIYTATNSWSGADTFTYTLNDGRGGSASAVITINVTSAAGPANITGITVSGVGAVIAASGTAGASYTLQYTDSLTPINWQEALTTNVASGGGSVLLTNAPALPSFRFYRTKYVSGP